MTDEIRNKVQESGLVNLDLAKFKADQALISEIDIADQLWQGLILKEKDFRNFIKEHDWSQYTGKYVFIHCTADAIVPTWAYMLVASCLTGISKAFTVGSKGDLEKIIIQENIAALDLNQFENKRYIIKGCSDISCPEFAMSELVKKLQPTAKSIMYGEPCSTVPVYKAKA